MKTKDIKGLDLPGGGAAARQQMFLEQREQQDEPYITDHSDDEGVITIYMDKVDFDHEVGKALGGNRVYPSQENLEKHQPCSNSCGIVEVEMRLKHVVKETDFSERPKYREALKKKHRK